MDKRDDITRLKIKKEEKGKFKVIKI